MDIRLKEIEERMSAISVELDKDDVDMDALESEITALKEERAKITTEINAEIENLAQRKATALAITAGTEPNIKILEKREEPKPMEERAKKLIETGKMEIGAEETRSVLLDSGTLAKPTSVKGIHDPFNTVSSIVDLVFVDDLTGVGSHKEAYLKTWQEAKDNVSYGTAPDASDPAFRTVAINPFPMDVLTYVGKNLRKQTPLAYEDKVRRGALIALRKKAASWIIKGNGSNQAFGIYNAVNTEDSPESLTHDLLVAKNYAIDEKTLRNLVFSYGGDENVGAGAKLFINKTDLIAFGDVRGTNEKKAVYEITPDGANPNTGIIKDGGLSVPYVICSDVTALTGSSTAGAARIKTMIYGDPKAYKMGLFGGYEISVSEDYKFAEGLLAVKGEAMIGGNIIYDKAFVVLTKKATADG